MTCASAAPIFALIAVLAWRRLVAKGYSRLVASAIVTLVLVQLAVCMGERNAFFAPVLGLGMYAMAASTFSLARDQSVRGIIRAGCALAGAQLIMPFGGLFTAAILPALIAIPKSVDGRAKSLGVLVLLLFMPALAAASLWATQFHSFTVAAPNGFSIRDFFLDAVLLIFCPALTLAGFRKPQWTSLIPVLVGCALLIAVTAGAMTGFGYSPRELAPAAASLLLIAASELPASDRRAQYALFLAGAAAAAACLAIPIVSP